MSLIKTPQEIEIMREGGALLSRALGEAVRAVRPGVALKEIDVIGERAIREGGGEPSFLGYRTRPSDVPFPSTICLSVNEEVVHGLGNRDRKLKDGDILGLDIGCWFKGLCTDMAVTVPVGRIVEDRVALIDAARVSLMEALKAVRPGAMIIDISRAIEGFIKPRGYGIVKTLTGHGVGHKVHEDPRVPNFVDRSEPPVLIAKGMCLAIEPMIGLGTGNVMTAPDGWAVCMADGKPGAHFEVTVAVTDEGAEILTPLPV